MEATDATRSPAAAPLTGVAAGVPYVALPPAGGARQAPLVVAWHVGPPGGGQAMAAALPLARLPAWRLYLRLPLVAAGAPIGGPEVLGASGEDHQLRPGPMVAQAAAGFPAVVAALRASLPVDEGPIGLVGESLGAAVALLALAEDEVPVQAAALLRPAVELERADQIAGRDPQPALLLVTGAHDADPVRGPAERPWQALASRYRDPGRVGLLIVPDLGPALVQEPGPHPARRTVGAARVDAAVTGWLDRHLISKEAS